MDCIERRTYSRKENLHINVLRGVRRLVPHEALHILACPQFLSQGRDRAPDDLERQLRQFQFLSQLVQHPLAEVARLQWTSEPPPKDKRSRRHILTLRLQVFAPLLQLLEQILTDRHL